MLTKEANYPVRYQATYQPKNWQRQGNQPNQTSSPIENKIEVNYFSDPCFTLKVSVTKHRREQTKDKIPGKLSPNNHLPPTKSRGKGKTNTSMAHTNTLPILLNSNKTINEIHPPPKPPFTNNIKVGKYVNTGLGARSNLHRDTSNNQVLVGDPGRTLVHNTF